MTEGDSPLRYWGRYCPSYSASNGRAAKSTEGPRSSYNADGESWTCNSQMPVGQTAPGTPSLKQLDAMRTQGGDVRKRPLG
jgi:hypothetical protein